MRLRHVLASISLAAPLTACCVRDEIWHDRRVILPVAPDEQLATLIQACEEAQDCEPLCLYDWNDYAPNHYADYESEVRDCELAIDAIGHRVLSYEGLEYCVAGRRPGSYQRGPARAPSRAGAYLADQAALEAASIRAFADLHADLRALEAPRLLQHAAIRAAADEVRHTATCAQLARRYGARLPPVTVRVAPRRGVRALALDNAVEGCVRETYGAVVSGYQARAAADPAVRSAMATIARDEARHAELAWQLQRWLAPQLDAADRSAIAHAVAGARAELRAAVSVHEPELATLGVPPPAVAHAMLDALEAI
ncbi:MAG TPA: hypothetical protein VFQ53_36185 [Kofleriaceae bacterium]|nr:hypothetical protein [Kofleriaceae bacterium]